MVINVTCAVPFENVYIPIVVAAFEPEYGVFPKEIIKLPSDPLGGFRTRHVTGGISELLVNTGHCQWMTNKKSERIIRSTPGTPSGNHAYIRGPTA